MEKNEFKIGERRMRTIGTEFQTRDDGDAPVIEGYFAVFNSNYDMGMGMSESIAPGAFSRSISNDVRALTNHDTTLVLGRTKVNTLELKEDSHGLWGHIDINPNDGDAMNLYERVKRGDVDQCSFGFNTFEQNTDIREDGSVHWTLTRVDLDEVSCCTFPAYDETNISARSAERDDIQKRAREAWKQRTMNKLKGETDGTESIDASQED